MRLFPTFLLAVLAVAAVAPRAAAQPSPAQIEASKKAAAEAADAALEAFEAGKYAEAIAGFEAADRAFHAPKFLLYIARAQVATGRLVAAKRTYGAIVGEKLPVFAPTEFFSAQTAARKELAELTPRIPTLTLQGRGGVTSATVDGSAAPLDQPIPVDPGSHTVTGTGEGAREARVVVTLAERDSKTAVLEPAAGPPAETPPEGSSPGQGAGQGLFASMPVPTYVAYGAGAVGLVLGGVFGGLTLAAKGDHDALLRAGAVDPKQANDLASQGRTFAAVTDVGFALALAGAATGTIWWVVAPRAAGGETNGSAGPRLHVAPGVGGLVAFGSF